MPVYAVFVLNIVKAGLRSVSPVTMWWKLLKNNAWVFVFSEKFCLKVAIFRLFERECAVYQQKKGIQRGISPLCASQDPPPGLRVVRARGRFPKRYMQGVR